MKLTTKSEYSLLALIYLARQEQGTFIPIEEICAHYNISKKYLEQLLTVLKQNRYIKAKRGDKGGYQLIVPPEKISLAEIIRLMDGALAPTESVSQYFFSHTPIEKESKVLGILKGIRDHIAQCLENLSLADVT